MGTRRRCLAPDAQSAVGASTRGQATVPDVETKRSALDVCLSMGTYSYYRLQQLRSSQSTSWAGMLYRKKTKYQDRLDAFGKSLSRYTTNRGNRRGLGLLGQTPSAADLVPLFAARNNSWLLSTRIFGRTVSPNFKYIRFLRIYRPLRFSKYAADNSIWSKLKIKIYTP